MIAKIIYAKGNGKRGTFFAVNYNTGKVDKNKGELMKVANFGPLQALSKLRPQDYINYLEMVSAQNKNVREPQFHAVISAKGREYDKQTLAIIAERWVEEMGYGTQPYLLVFHKDTDNNHIHIVSTRVDRDGRKINSGHEKRRAVWNIQKVLGYDFGFEYKFSTRAQFLTVLDEHGFLGTDPNGIKVQQRIDRYVLNKKRAEEIKAILQHVRNDPDFIRRLKDEFHINLIFHASEGKKPYGYTIIDEDDKTVYKGSEVLALRALLGEITKFPSGNTAATEKPGDNIAPARIQSIYIADDVDDQQTHGMRRRRQKKSIKNTR